mgnify:CR=1 FL=1
MKFVKEVCRTFRRGLSDQTSRISYPTRSWQIFRVVECGSPGSWNNQVYWRKCGWRAILIPSGKFKSSYADQKVLTSPDLLDWIYKGKFEYIYSIHFTKSSPITIIGKFHKAHTFSSNSFVSVCFTKKQEFLCCTFSSYRQFPAAIRRALLTFIPGLMMIWKMVGKKSHLWLHSI